MHILGMQISSRVLFVFKIVISLIWAGLLGNLWAPAGGYMGPGHWGTSGLQLPGICVHRTPGEPLGSSWRSCGARSLGNFWAPAGGYMCHLYL